MGRIFTVDFTRNFIDEVAAYVEREYVARGRGLDRLAVVFGGKRPAYFLKRQLGRGIGKGFIPPRFFTVDEFMDHTANADRCLAAGRELDLCFVLYRLASRITPELVRGRESFAQFLPWAREILDFIEQLDLEDVDNSALLSIQENARIGYAVPDSINGLLRHIKLLREAFHGELEAKGRTFRGLQYLRAASEVRNHGWEEFDEIMFCGLFYFHRTEEEVVRWLHGLGKATLVFQGDQRKWPVLQRIAERFGCELLEGAEPTPTTFRLHVHAGFDVHSQVAVARDILTGSREPDRTVVVLPESGQLVPLLSELPPGLTDINVSMGYPLQRSSLSFLLDFVMRAQLSRKGGRYYARDYLKVLQHPFIKNLRLTGEGEAVRALVHRIEEVLTGRVRGGISGSSFLALEEVLAEEAVFACGRADSGAAGPAGLRGVLGEIHRAAFEEWEGVNDLKDFAGALGRFLDLVVDKSFLPAFPLNIKIAERMYAIKDEFARAGFSGEPFAFAELARIFQDQLAREKVNFSGTPLKGLQVLGLFETRSLSFDHVIILDANEGVLPKLDIRSSLVPREVMLSLRLDRLELEEEIQRYQFMRIISSAKEVHLVYQERDDRERSRFIEELAWEADKKAGRPAGLPLERAAFAVQVEPARRSAEKTPSVLDFLRGFRYSASSINLYLKNPYEFYTTHVLGLREADDLLDEPDGRQIGNYLHELLEEAYKPLLRRPFVIDDAFGRRLARLAQEKFDATLARSMRSDAFLLKAVIDHRLKVFLEKEREAAEGVEQVLFLEHPFESLISLGGRDVHFYCKVDRVDRLKDGTVLVIDYKSGGGDRLPRPDAVRSGPFSRERLFNDLRSFQLPLYYYFLSREFPRDRVLTELFNLREAKREAFPKASVAGHDEFLRPYLEALEYVVAEILDPKVPFIDDDLQSFD